MLTDHWPLAGLRVRTPRLELRLPDGAELAALADVALAGVHPPEQMPFAHPWTDLPPAERGRSVLQHHWRALADWSAERWVLPLAVFVEGRPVGIQAVQAQDFAVLRQVSTGSWLGQAHQGRGIGTEMRRAVLHLAFAGLGAEEAVSGAHDDNPASLAVTRKLGYRPDGVQRAVVRGRRSTELRFRLDRAEWADRDEFSITGLSPCLPMFGV
ncbi:GNAT family protein [Saccharopolyspora cebuensis]|uniref:GNAT family protein n=1 Tax=Saccharopolyspora cebuensis TaxID=418759 RepID=A0ABV4CNV6_9PSEU